MEIGSFHKGMKDSEKELLVQTILRNVIRNEEGKEYINPGICVELSFRALEDDCLSDVVFQDFKLNLEWKQCTWQQLILRNTIVDQELAFTNLDKVIWENPLIKFHIPFQSIRESNPLEIVFDLDPPSRAEFSLAIKAALEMKKIFDGFDIVSFPKVSGSKGIQIHIPVADRRFTYDEARLFTAFVARYLVEQFPADFTIERMKRNLANRLYIDYVQFGEGCSKEINHPAAPL